MLVKFRGSDDTFEIKGYAFSKPKCYICERDEDTYGRTLDLWYCEEMRIFWCRDHAAILNEEHKDIKIARCYNGHGWHHPSLSGVVNADTE
jgi:hypothetical protein